LPGNVDGGRGILRPLSLATISEEKQTRNGRQ
jgi:hypothetical protein